MAEVIFDETTSPQSRRSPPSHKHTSPLTSPHIITSSHPAPNSSHTAALHLTSHHHHPPLITSHAPPHISPHPRHNEKRGQKKRKDSTHKSPPTKILLHLCASAFPATSPTRPLNSLKPAATNPICAATLAAAAAAACPPSIFPEPFTIPCCRRSEISSLIAASLSLRARLRFRDEVGLPLGRRAVVGGGG